MPVLLFFEAELDIEETEEVVEDVGECWTLQEELFLLRISVSDDCWISERDIPTLEAEIVCGFSLSAEFEDDRLFVCWLGIFRLVDKFWFWLLVDVALLQLLYATFEGGELLHVGELSLLDAG